MNKLSLNSGLKQKKFISRFNKHHRFTLVELLVVIAIIAVLASILMPALESAIGVARSMQCVNNLKQIQLSAQFYVNDYNNCWWPWAFWPRYLANALNFEMKESSVSVCPEDKNPPNASYCNNGDNWKGIYVPASGIYKLSYGYNYRFGGTILYAPGKYIDLPEEYDYFKAALIKNPSRTICFGDGNSAGGAWLINKYGLPPWADKYLPGRRHAAKPNFSFFDGHVKTFSYEGSLGVGLEWLGDAAGASVIWERKTQ